MKSKIELMDTEGNSLYTFDMNEINLAYDKARELEEMGIEVTLKKPSLPETLGKSLGMSDEEGKTLKNEIDEEVESHNHPTCR